MAEIAQIRAELAEALTRARHEDLDRIRDALALDGVVGVHGEAEVGVTSVVAETLRSVSAPFIRVDLATAASQGAVAWQLARGLARVWMGADAPGTSDASPIPPRSSYYLRFAETVGLELAGLATADQPPDRAAIDPVLSAIGEVFRGRETPILWFDTLGAPTAIVRHPVDVDALLWNVRSFHQRLGARVVLSGRRVTTAIASDRSGAFHGDGEWVTLDRPPFDVWIDAVDLLDRRWMSVFWRFTRGHPATILLGLSLRDGAPLRDASPGELWEFLLALDDGLTARAVEHARSLHRLGGVTFERIANGLGPYAEAGTPMRRKEINRAVNRLHEAGLITQPRPRTWEITNPLIDGRLRAA